MVTFRKQKTEDTSNGLLVYDSRVARRVLKFTHHLHPPPPQTSPHPPPPQTSPPTPPPQTSQFNAAYLTERESSATFHPPRSSSVYYYSLSSLQGNKQSLLALRYNTNQSVSRLDMCDIWALAIEKLGKP